MGNTKFQSLIYNEEILVYIPIFILWGISYLLNSPYLITLFFSIIGGIIGLYIEIKLEAKRKISAILRRQYRTKIVLFIAVLGSLPIFAGLFGHLIGVVALILLVIIVFRAIK